MTRLTLLSIFGLSFAVAGVVCAASPVKVTVQIRGVVTGKDAEALQTSLKQLSGIQVRAVDIQPGEKGQFGHYFSPPFALELKDLQQLNIGGVAKAVAETKTPSRGEVEPSLNLVFFHPMGRITEEDVASLKTAVQDVNGLKPFESGGVGGAPDEGRMWVRLEAAGGAELQLILDALKKAELDLKLERP